MLKALTLTQPWASLVAGGHKSVETRSWSTKHRGVVAIHAAKGFPTAARRFAAEERALGRLPGRVPTGAIIALAWIASMERTEEIARTLTGLERHLGDYTHGRYAWVLDPTRLVVLPEPIGCRGALGLWTVPEAIEALIDTAAGGGAC